MVVVKAEAARVVAAAAAAVETALELELLLRTMAAAM